VPVWALQAGASLLGKGDAVQRLCGNLQVDMSKARSLLGWVPPVSVEKGLRRAMGAGDDYNSHNTERLDILGMQTLLMKLRFMQAVTRGEHVELEE